MTKEWKNYEEVAEYLINQFASEFGLIAVEGKQKITGSMSGTDWEIDAKGIKENNEGFVVIECRRFTNSRQNQERVAGLAYRILDLGAAGGLIVTPLGLQSGAKKIAKAQGIAEVTLTPGSTKAEYVLGFLNRVMVGVSERVSFTGGFVSGRYERADDKPEAD